MAYDLHLVRTKDWTEAATAPITRQDVDALIAADSELAWSTTDYVEMNDETGVPARYFMITCRGEPCFWWYRDQIQCSDPDDAQQLKLVQMAGALSAYVVGDDGEIYPLKQTPCTVSSALDLDGESSPRDATCPLVDDLSESLAVSFSSAVCHCSR